MQVVDRPCRHDMYHVPKFSLAYLCLICVYTKDSLSLHLIAVNSRYCTILLVVMLTATLHAGLLWEDDHCPYQVHHQTSTCHQTKKRGTLYFHHTFPALIKTQVFHLVLRCQMKEQCNKHVETLMICLLFRGKILGLRCSTLSPIFLWVSVAIVFSVKVRNAGHVGACMLLPARSSLRSVTIYRFLCISNQL